MNKLRNRLIVCISTIVFFGILALAFTLPAYLPEKETTLTESVETPVALEEAATAAVSPQEMALEDQKGRLSEGFDIPEGMRRRVAFWLDIYSKYDSRHYVIHHREYPWIVFDVANTSDIFTQSRVQWLNRRDADTLSSVKKDSVISTLKMLAVRSSYENLPAEEARVFDLLKEIEGPRKHVIREAIKAVRIQLGQKDMFEMGLVRSAPYIPMMEQIFESQGLPKDLVRLPLVESSFNSDAHSRVGARGAWQIMPNIGRKKMMIDNIIDERESPLKSAQFAAYILKQNKQILKQWPLAVTAYNHGSGSLLKAIRKLKTTELQEIIDQNNARSFQFASSNFYACFMAALRGEMYASELFPELKRPAAMVLTKIKVPKKTAVGAFAKKLGFELKDLQAMNPELPNHLRPNFQLPAGFQLYIRDQKPTPEEIISTSPMAQNSLQIPYVGSATVNMVMK
jgi:membrane-bound lytic murein transglycosylase D